MTWIYIGVLVILLIIIFISLRNKGKDPNVDASLTTDEQEGLEEDYITHGSNDDEHEDQKNI